MVAEGGDLISDPFEGVAEPAAIDDESARDGGALGLVAIKMDVHIKENVLRQLLSIECQLMSIQVEYFVLLIMGNSLPRLSNNKIILYSGIYNPYLTVLH